MGKHDPICVREKTAAAMLDMQPCEFRKLVDQGHLPRPRHIGGLPRWNTDELRRIVTGGAIMPARDFDL